jgi:chromosome segregation ATPase
MFENKFNEEIRLTTSLLSKVKTDNSALEQKIETFKTAIQKLQETEKSLNKQLEKCAEEKENMLKKHEERKEIFAQRVNKISKSEPNVDEVRRTLEDLRNQKMKKEEDFDSLKEQSCEFFVKLRDIIMSNLSNMNAIRTDIFNMLVESLKKVDSVQNEIAEDLHKLDELKE